MVEGSSSSIRILTWNLAFASRKEDFVSDDFKRADAIIKSIQEKQPHIVLLQEMATREYADGKVFDFSSYLQSISPKSTVFYLSALSLPDIHSNPYGKKEKLLKSFSIIKHTQGLGLVSTGVLPLCNLYSDDPDAVPTVEATHPLPVSLYMGNEMDKSSAGRDDEDRPALWSRFGIPDNEHIKLFVVSLHLPTLKGERSNTHNKQPFSPKQQELRDITLSKPGIHSIDKLGSELRLYYLRHILSQCQRLEDYWQQIDTSSRCIFVLAGDFNFDHNNEHLLEFKLLTQHGFLPSFRHTSSKTSGQLTDNIWIKSDVEFSIHTTSKISRDDLSDHKGLVAEINIGG